MPRINDGSLLFLQHKISKFYPVSEDGSKIAIVFNGSPLFTGDAGSGESNIRRWIIENDWLDAVVALPDQMFYNTGIFTSIWLVTNRKQTHRKGKVQLIDGTKHFQKMKKSLGNKRNELSDAHIAELVRLYGAFSHDETSVPNADEPARICSKVLDNSAFGFLKMTVERPLRLNFLVSEERIGRLWQQRAFVNLAVSKKRKDKGAIAQEIAAGEAIQQAIIAALRGMKKTLYKSRKTFLPVLNAALKAAEAETGKLKAPVKKAILTALSEHDAEAEICCDKKGQPEADSSLRDTEIVPLPEDIALPLPLGYEDKADNSELVALVRGHCEAYLEKEVLPHVPDAWIDHEKTKVGYEIPLNRHFYVYEPPRSLSEIEADIKALETDIVQMLGTIV